MTRPGIEPRSPGPLANTLPTWPMFEIESAKRVQILVDEAVSVLPCSNALGKDMDPDILPFVKSK